LTVDGLTTLWAIHGLLHSRLTLLDSPGHAKDFPDKSSATTMIGLPIFRRYLLFFIACVTLAGGFARLPNIGVTSLKAATLIELQGYLLNHKADLDLFGLRGPFAVTIQKEFEIRLSITERINTDLFLFCAYRKSPPGYYPAWI
jgi:hypothetical protein